MQPQHNLDIVVVTTGPSRPDDEMMTRNLLASTLQGDTYKCPRCAFNTQNPEEMIQHLADEMNKSIKEIVALYAPPPPLKPEAK